MNQLDFAIKQDIDQSSLQYEVLNKNLIQFQQSPIRDLQGYNYPIQKDQIYLNDDDLVNFFDFSKNPDPLNFKSQKDARNKKRVKINAKGPYGISKKKTEAFRKYVQHQKNKAVRNKEKYIEKPGFNTRITPQEKDQLLDKNLKKKEIFVNQPSIKPGISSRLKAQYYDQGVSFQNKKYGKKQSTTKKLRQSPFKAGKKSSMKKEKSKRKGKFLKKKSKYDNVQRNYDQPWMSYIKKSTSKLVKKLPVREKVKSKDVLINAMSVLTKKPIRTKFKSEVERMEYLKENNPVLDNIYDLQAQVDDGLPLIFYKQFSKDTRRLKRSDFARKKRGELTHLEKLYEVEKSHTRVSFLQQCSLHFQAEQLEINRQLEKLQKQQKFQKQMAKEISDIKKSKKKKRSGEKELFGISKFIPPKQDYSEKMLLFQENAGIMRSGMQFNEAIQYLTHQIKSNLPKAGEQPKQKFKKRRQQQPQEQVEVKSVAVQGKLDNFTHEYKEKLLQETEDNNNQFLQISSKLQEIQQNLLPIQNQVDNLLQRQNQNQFGSFTTNLLSRMSGKLIQTYANDITDLIVDDLLVEMVLLLNQADEIKKSKNAQQKQKQLMKDYLEQIDLLKDDQNKILQNINKRTTNNLLTDFYKENVDSVNRARKQKSLLNIDPDLYDLYGKIKVSAPTLGVVERLLKKRQEFKDNQSQYEVMSKRNVDAYQFITEKIIEEEISKVYNEFEQIEHDMVAKVYSDEFQ